MLLKKISCFTNSLSSRELQKLKFKTGILIIKFQLLKKKKNTTHSVVFTRLIFSENPVHF